VTIRSQRKTLIESTDTYDTIEFLLKNIPNNNDKVGIWGISYHGFFTSASIIDSHPALKAASPQAPMTDLFGRRCVSWWRVYAGCELWFLYRI
jgi:predicted acyl esterase